MLFRSYNGSSPGPTIEAVEGDRVRIFVTNKLPEHTTAHWHGVQLPSGMDGVGGLTQPHIPPGKTFVYEFTLTRSGTFTPRLEFGLFLEELAMQTPLGVVILAVALLGFLAAVSARPNRAEEQASQCAATLSRTASIALALAWHLHNRPRP